LYLTFAWRYFKAKKTTHAINIIAWVTVSVIAFATACQLLVLSVFNGFEDLVKSLYSSFYTDIKILPASGKTCILTKEQIEKIKQVPYIDNISLVAEEKAVLKNNEGDAQTVISLKGVDDNFVNTSGVASSIYKGKFILGDVNNPGLVVGSGVQNKAGIILSEAMPSDSLTIILPKKNSDNNDPLQTLSEGNVKTTGVFSIQQEFDDAYAITNLDFVKQQIGMTEEEYSAAEIKLVPKTDLNETALNLQKLLGSNYKIKNRYQQNMSLYNTMQMEKWAIYAVLTLILIIAAFNMVSALTMLVLEKQKDISVLQSMGAGNTTVQKIFLTEGLLLGLIGAVTGILMATVICLLQIKYKLIPLQGGSFLINYFPVKMLLRDFLLVAATAIVIAFLAAWYPAKKASMQKIDLR
jgi:lipoprotein-releasing system permease protein